VLQDLGTVASRCFLAANHILAGIPTMYLIERVTKSSMSVTSDGDVPRHGGEIGAETPQNRPDSALGGLSPQLRSR
jgi:hypothetical protein